MLWHINVNDILSPQTNVLFGNTEEDIRETVLFYMIFNSQNSIRPMGRYILSYVMSFCNNVAQNDITLKMTLNKPATVSFIC